MKATLEIIGMECGGRAVRYAYSHDIRGPIDLSGISFPSEETYLQAATQLCQRAAADMHRKNRELAYASYFYPTPEGVKSKCMGAEVRFLLEEEKAHPSPSVSSVRGGDG